MNTTYHKMLQRQIHKTLGDNPQLTPELEQLLQRVSEAYTQADEDHTLIERSLEISSEELNSINKDIEEKVRQRTQELREEHVRFASSINSLGVGFIMCDTTDRITMMNPAMQHLLASRPAGSEDHPAGPDNQAASASRADWTLNEVDGILRPDFELKAALHDSIKSGNKAEFKHVALGAKTLHLFVAPIIAAQESGASRTLGAVILVEDVTEQAIIERSKDEFFSIASHELRTPLTAIQGNTAILQKYYPDLVKDPEVAAIVSDIHASAVRLIAIVSDFLDVSALEQGKIPLELTDFLPQDLIGGLTHDLENICSAKGLQFVIEPNLADVPLVTADEVRIKQVVYNLVGNAAKFTEKGSVTLSGRTDDHFAYITVADTGRGMSDSDQQLLFHKFQQASNSLLTRDTPKGTGLGLYISKLIVEHSGGTIRLERSEIGKGSSFTFSLPLAKAKPQGAAS